MTLETTRAGTTADADSTADAHLAARRQTAVAEAAAAFAAANPASADRHEAASRSMPGGNTRSVLYHPPFPLAFASGHDARLVSLDGREYVDLLGEYTAGLFGHSEPRIIAALHETLDRGISFGGHNGLEAEFAALLVARFPAMERVRLTNSGTEANLMALALATAATGRSEILAFGGAYHGGVLAFGGGSSSPVNVPHDWVLGDYNDIEGTRALIREHASSLAAVIVEPMLGSGGAIRGSDEFLHMLRAEATDAGALLVLDEVMTSRLSPSGLQSVVGITPDLMTVGKYLGGGMSFGAFGGRADLMNLFDPSSPTALAHAGTFNNNVLTMTAGIVALRDILTSESLAALNARGDRLRDALEQLFAERDVAMRATGVGSILTIHIVGGEVRSPADLVGQDPLLKRLLFLDLLEDGFWIAARGMLALSLPVTDADADAFVAAVARFIDRRRELLPAR